MKQFTHLTSRIINKLHITQIIKHPNHYEICMTNNTVGGFFLLGNGTIDTNFTPFNISNADFYGIKTIKKCKINRRAFPFGLFLNADCLT